MNYRVKSKHRWGIIAISVRDGRRVDLAKEHIAELREAGRFKGSLTKGSYITILDA